jgi:hypothetical protein
MRVWSRVVGRRVAQSVPSCLSLEGHSSSQLRYSSRMLHQCVVDGVEFEGRANALYCSSRCRKAAQRGASTAPGMSEPVTDRPVEGHWIEFGVDDEQWAALQSECTIGEWPGDMAKKIVVAWIEAVAADEKKEKAPPKEQLSQIVGGWEPEWAVREDDLSRLMDD